MGTDPWRDYRLDDKSALPLSSALSYSLTDFHGESSALIASGIKIEEMNECSLYNLNAAFEHNYTHT